MEATLFDFPKLEITNKIRLIELFGGIGSQAMALRDIGANFEHYRLVEFDKYAVASYNAIHGTSFETSDIRNVHGADLGITERDKFTYIMTYSFPCLTADSLILTSDGYKELKDVNVGDVVLTKSNTWQKVAKKFDNGIHDTCFINSFGFKNLHCTLNHKFYVREMYRKYPTYENGKRGNERHFKEPVFKEAKDLSRKDYFGIPVIEDEKPFYTDELDFWYMIGFYFGDGWISKTGYDIRLSCCDSKLEKLQKHLDKDKWNYTINDSELSCHKLRFANREIYEWIKDNIGTGCCEKRIPCEILTLPKEQLAAFLEGYIDSDGNVNENGKHDYIRISSVNQNLVYSVSLIVNKLYHRPASINVEKSRKNAHYIDGREIKNRVPLYEIKFKTSTDKQDKAFYEKGYIWFPFYGLKTAEKEHVYNMEVENDHSYIVNGCISKNCTDLSVAGKMQGMSKAEWESGNSTRSGLLWEVERILKELPADELPQVLLMENVPQVHAEQNKEDFEAWIAFLRSRGYFNFYQDLNAKDYGIPQNRERCFCVSILSPDFIDYEFPKQVKLDTVIKDFLEDKVEEKYYLNNEKAKKLLINLKEKKMLLEIEKEAVDGTINDPKIRNVSNTITTRISASGICNHKQESMAVVEKVKKTICRMTGRNPENPKSRKSGLPTEQMIEPNAQGICGALTTVQKDNLVLGAKTTRGKNICSTIRSSYFKNGERNIAENVKNGKGYEGVIEIKQVTKEGSIKCKVGGCYDASYPDSTTPRGRVQEGGDVTPTLTANSSENIHYVETQYRIRKLTPRECWRLMGYTDTDFDRASQVNSNTQLYKQAGNAIVKQVLMAIFAQMIPESARQK